MSVMSMAGFVTAAAVWHRSIKRIEKEKDEEQKTAPPTVPAFKQKQSED